MNPFQDNSGNPEIVFSYKCPDRGGIDALRADIDASVNLLEADINNQFLRRMYVRSVFAMVEGNTDYLKTFTYSFAIGMLHPIQIVLGAIREKCPIPLISDIHRSDELDLLRDERIEVRPTGEIRPRVQHLDFKTNIRFTIRTFGKVFKVPIDPDLFNSTGWCSLIQGEEIRNDITHPKTSKNIEVTDAHLPIIRQGGQWVYDTYGHLLSESGASMEKAGNDFSAWMNTLENDIARDLALFISVLNGTKNGKST